MRTELLPGMTNVIRFPVEWRARPTIEALQEFAPDIRTVLSIAEAFDVDPPARDLRDIADRETAEHILNSFDLAAIQPGALDEMLAPVVSRAIATCRELREACIVAQERQRTLEAARVSGSTWLDHLVERLEAAEMRLALLSVEAHALAEQALGAARAVSLAKRGEPWTPRNFAVDEEAVFGFGRRVG